MFIVFAGFVGLETHIPVALLEILAGIFAANLLGVESTAIIEVLANFGIMALMYLAGLEIDLDLLRRKAKVCSVIGLASFLAPFLTILGFSHFFLDFSTMQSLLVGIALSTTSIAIVYPLMLEAGELTEKKKTILSAVMVTDLASIITLGVFFSTFSFYTIIFIAVLSLIPFLAPNLGETIFARYQKNVVSFELRIVLLSLLGISVLSESIGVEQAILAFGFGIVTSQLVVKHSDLVNQLRGLTFGFLTPIFFFSIGLSIKLAELRQSLGLIVIFVILAFSSKFIGTYFAAKPFFKKEAFFIAELFNARLSIGIIAAALGLKNQIIDERVFSAIIGSVVVLTIISAFSVFTKEFHDASDSA